MDGTSPDDTPQVRVEGLTMAFGAKVVQRDLNFEVRGREVFTIAGASGNFQLNVMLPVIAHNLLQSIGLLANASRLLADTAIAGFTVRGDRLQAALGRNPILVTALNPVIGYEKAAAIAKQAYREGRPVLDVAREVTGLPDKRLRELLDPAALARGGIHGKPGGGAG